jgi:hypothetical protein
MLAPGFGTELERQTVFGPPEAADHLKIDLTMANGMVIIAISDVVQMPADQAVHVVLQLFAVVDHPHVRLEFSMTRVVPVTAVILAVIIQARQKGGEVGIDR